MRRARSYHNSKHNWRNEMRNLLAAVLLLLAGHTASAQSVQQSGTVTPNHIPCWVTTGVINDCGLGPTELVNGNFNIYLDTVGHKRVTGSTPVLTNCGTSPAIVGTDLAGTVTMGTASPTGCTITFANPYTNTPHCNVQWQATPLASQSYALSPTAISLTQTATSSNKANYNCTAQPGG